MIMTKNPIGERMMAVETKLVDIEKKLDKFIESADSKYCPAHVMLTVDKNCNDIDKIKSKLAYYSGGIAILFTIINIVIAIYF